MRRREQSQLNPLEQAILRNCYFARGAAFYELGRLEEAIEAYSAATNRYHNEPEVLDAPDLTGVEWPAHDHGRPE